MILKECLSSLVLRTLSKFLRGSRDVTVACDSVTSSSLSHGASPNTAARPAAREEEEEEEEEVEEETVSYGGALANWTVVGLPAIAN